MIYRFLIICGLCGALPLHAGEETLYRAEWGKAGAELANWTTTAPESRTVTDPKLGPAFEFGPGSASLRLPARGGHQVRFRFTATYRPDLDAGAQPYAANKPLDYVPLSGQGMFSRARPDPQEIELGLVLPETADSLVFSLKTSGRIALGAFAVADLGAPTPYVPDGKELLTDPGWEGLPSRTAIPAENSYGIQLNGWMGWAKDSVETLMVTSVPSRVRTGKQALMVTAANGGLRQLDGVKAKLGRCYDLSVWAKGHGQFAIYDVGYRSSRPFVVSANEWRQFHYPICVDNPARPSFSMGIYVQGRLFLDDFSIREITRSEGDVLVQANRALAVDQPVKVAQTVPAGEKRSGEPLILENDQARVTLSPKGGGRVVEFCDKRSSGPVWSDVALLGLAFPGQPVPVEWNLPFRAEMAPDGTSVTFSHTATGGAAAPFLDGVRIDQTFTLQGRMLVARIRLSNSSGEWRYLLTEAVNQWSAANDVRGIAAAGDKGLVMARESAQSVRELAAGWTALCMAADSLVMGFDVQAVRTARLDPVRRSVTWQYLRVPLPPGGSWETSAFVVPAPLPGIDYADRNLAAQVRLTQSAALPSSVPTGSGLSGGDATQKWPDRLGPARGSEPIPLLSAAASGNKLTALLAGATAKMSLELVTAEWSAGVTARARVLDYENRLVAQASAGQGAIEFTPPASRFVTCLDITAGGTAYTVELFNDPPERLAGSGIDGAGTLQYVPTIPIRVLRFPDIGDQRSAIAASKRALWAYGLFSQYYPLENVLTAKGMTTEILDGAGGFPEESDELLAYRLVILSNLGAAQLSAASRASLSQYVRAGGALLVIGGSRGLGNARTLGTDLEELLPVKLTGPFEVLPRQGREARLTVLSDWLGRGMAGLGLAEQPCLFWAHRVTARPGARIVARVGAEPALVSGTYGRGRVVLFAGTVEGEPKPGELPAWEWSGWKPFWQQTLEPLLANP